MKIDWPWICNGMLISIRLGTLLFLTPISPIQQIPSHIRIFFILIFSFLMANTLQLADSTFTAVSLLGAGSVELFNGVLLALSVFAVFGSFNLAGYLIDSQMGLNITSLLNPQTHSQESVTARFLTLLAGYLFFISGSHRLLLKGIAFSLLKVPPGTLFPAMGLTPALEPFAYLFVLGMMIAAPLVFTLLFIDVSAGFIARSTPQINLYFITLPLKILLGFSMLGMLLTHLETLANSVFAQIFRNWQGLLS